MARRHDSGWRDSRLNLVHGVYGVPLPAAGMSLPMVEYDRGEPLAVINYVRRDEQLPKGPHVGAAFHAFSRLYGPHGTQLPFFTVRYDPRNWAMQLFAHNDPALHLIGTPAWLTVTEAHFVRLLYRVRGRTVPANLSDYDVRLSTAPWIRSAGTLQQQGWPGQDMSVRRREYEPEGPRVRFSVRNPCTDIDLAVIGDSSRRVKLLVDYKLEGAYVEPGHKTHQAMSAILDGTGEQVPSMIVRYDPTGDRWKFHVLPLNASAQALLYLFMVRTRALAPGGGSCEGWTYVDEDRWDELLNEVKRDT